MCLPAISLCHRELVRFVRQPNRVIGALGTPIVFWLLIGAGVGRSFVGTAGGASPYIGYFFSGALLMILLFTAIFSTISIIEDRREGFLQSVLVSPAPRVAIVLGKVLGGTLLAAGQGLLFLLLAPLVGIKLSAVSVALAIAMMLLVAFSLTSLGFACAWRMQSTQGFHAIMNLLLMPLWFLSGALFPPGGAWTPMRYVIAANPLSYGLSALRHAIHWHDSAARSVEPSLAVCVAITALFAAGMFGVACFVARASAAENVQ